MDDRRSIMGWPSKLTYREIVATKVARSVAILAHYGDVATAEDLFAYDSALANDPEAFRSAARNGHEEFVRLMLRYQPALPRRVALVARTRKLTELLFAHGMNPSLPDWLLITPLHRFAERGDIESAAIFIDHGANLHARDEDICSTPLGWAAKFGRTSMVEFLLSRGAKPDRSDDPPWATPLAWATRRGHSDIVQLLTEYTKSGEATGGFA
jgi:ankyrin repeat protein